MKKITQTLTAALCYGVLGMAPALAQDIGSVTTEDVRRAATDACDDGSIYRVAYSHSVSEVAIVKQVRRFADERARYLGCVEVLHDNTQANNLEQQINAIQGWITLGVDAIVVLPTPPLPIAKITPCPTVATSSIKPASPSRCEPFVATSAMSSMFASGDWPTWRKASTPISPVDASGTDVRSSPAIASGIAATASSPRRCIAVAMGSVGVWLVKTPLTIKC